MDRKSVAQKKDGIQKAVLVALKHPEAEEGLYFRNFFQLHEEDERDIVPASRADIITALTALIKDGSVALDENEGEVVFKLA